MCLHFFFFFKDMNYLHQQCPDEGKPLRLEMSALKHYRQQHYPDRLK